MTKTVNLPPLEYWGTPIAQMTEVQFAAAILDASWRISHLYKIVDKDGNVVTFVPNAVQKQFISDLWFRNVVPKARQRGFSTVVQILILDACLFTSNTHAAIIAQDRDTARHIFTDKIKFAYDRLPDLIKLLCPVTSETKTELSFGNGSSVICAATVRGVTLQWLHVSEYGKICQKFPDKAAEIETGSLPAVDQHGIIVVESTVEGIDGQFSDMARNAWAKRQTGQPLSKLDYKLHFASWWDADEYETNPAFVTISPKDNAYFNRLEGKLGIELFASKRAWYVAKRDNDFGSDEEKMWRQYPSTIDEAFQVSTEGKWLATQMAAARRFHRITSVPYQPAYPVNTFWDLGVADDIAIWFHQQIGPNNHFINYIEGSAEAYAYFWAQMQAFGYVWGHHYLPHDGDQRRPGAESIKTPVDMLEDLGLRNVVTVPRVAMLQTGIQQLRDVFPTYLFDETNCKEGLLHLDGYSKTWNTRYGTWSATPLKNGHQHAADALRQHAQIADDVKRGGATKPRSKPKRRGGMTA